MRARKWVLVVALVAAFLGLMTYHGWSLFKANERIKFYLLSQIRPILGKESDIEAVEMGLGAMHLKGINLRSKDNFYSLRIEDLRVGYSLTSLIKSGFAPHKTTENILIIRPKLTIKYIPQNMTTLTENGSSKATAEKYLNQLTNFDFIKRITISKGQIDVIDSSGVRITLAQDINGWLSSKGMGYATARMAGKLFNSKEYNLLLDGEIDLIRARLNYLNADLRDFKMSAPIPLFLPYYFDIERGVINANLTISENKVGKKNFDLQGKVFISDGAFKLRNENLFFSNINIEAEIVNNAFIIKKASQTLNGSPVEIQGQIKNLWNPRFDIRLTSQLFDLSNFQDMLHPRSSFKVRGIAALQLSVEGSYENPRLNGKIESEKLALEGTVLENLKVELGFYNYILNLQRLSGQCLGHTIRGKGSVNFNLPNRPLYLEISADGSPPDELKIVGLNDLSSFQSQLEIKLSCSLSRLDRIEGETRLRLQSPSSKDELLNLRGDFFYRQGVLSWQAYSEENGFQVTSQLINLNKKPYFNFSLVNVQAPLIALTDLPWKDKLKNLLGLNLKLRGNFNRWDMEGVGFWKEMGFRKKQFVQLTAAYSEGKKEKRIKGKFTLFRGDEPYRAKFDLSYAPHLLKVKTLEVERLFSAEGRIELTGRKQIKGKLLMDKAEAARVAKFFFPKQNVIQQGKLSGEINCTGTLSLPEIAGRFIFTDGVINEVSNYGGTTSFRIDSSKLVMEKLSIHREGVPFLWSEGQYDFKTQRVKGSLTTRDVDLNMLVRSLTARRDLIQGRASMELTLTGVRQQPLLLGNLNVGKGRLGKFRFDGMSLSLGNPYTNSGAEENTDSDTPGAAIRIENFVLRREGDFQITGEGEVPLSSKGNLNVQIQATGNLLAILPEIKKGFFRKTDSQGQLNLRLAGSLDNPIIESGQWEFSNGSLKLGAVIPEIKELQGKVYLKPNSDFVHIEEISGKIRGSQFAISNLESAQGKCLRELSPFTIPDLGLSFGILVLNTSKKGIPLNIPGLMKKGEEGWFEIVNKAGDETFFVAGPFERPVVRGRINLRNVNFTFPFIKVPGLKNSPVTEVLKSIDWDVETASIKDVRYVRSILGALDEVYVNLQIDGGVGGLSFTGAVDDNSFRVEGNLESTKGTVEYLDFNFMIEKVGAEFDKSTLLPMIYGQARTMLTDSTGFPFYVYLTLYTIDEQTGQMQKKGRWGKIRLELSTDNPSLGETEGQILAALGYSGDNIKEKATDLLGISADNLLSRRLLRPFERQLERILGLDMIRLSPRFTHNLIEMDLNNGEGTNGKNYPKLLYLRSSKLMLGKYLANKLLFLYTGQLEVGSDYRYQQEGWGLRHTLGLEYRINPNWLLEMEYDYNSLLLIQKDDKRIRLRHSFPF